MSIANKEMIFDQKDIMDSLQDIHEQLQKIEHVLDIQVDHAIHETFQAYNQEINKAMKICHKR